jgi:hypothetical protein
MATTRLSDYLTDYIASCTTKKLNPLFAIRRGVEEGIEEK